MCRGLLKLFFWESKIFKVGRENFHWNLGMLKCKIILGWVAVNFPGSCNIPTCQGSIDQRISEIICYRRSCQVNVVSVNWYNPCTIMVSACEFTCIIEKNRWICFKCPKLSVSSFRVLLGDAGYAYAISECSVIFSTHWWR